MSKVVGDDIDKCRQNDKNDVQNIMSVLFHLLFLPKGNPKWKEYDRFWNAAKYMWERICKYELFIIESTSHDIREKSGKREEKRKEE